MLIELINKSLAIYGVLGKAWPEHGGVINISGVKCDRAGRLFYSSTRHWYKMLFTFSTAVVPFDSSDSFLQFRFDNSCEYLRKCTTWSIKHACNLCVFYHFLLQSVEGTKNNRELWLFRTKSLSWLTWTKSGKWRKSLKDRPRET